MGAALAQTVVDSYGLPRKRFRREEVDQLLESGFFAGQRYELIDGDLIDKMGQGPRHFRSIQLLAEAFSKIVARPDSHPGPH